VTWRWPGRLSRKSCVLLVVALAAALLSVHFLTDGGDRVDLERWGRLASSASEDSSPEELQGIAHDLAMRLFGDTFADSEGGGRDEEIVWITLGPISITMDIETGGIVGIVDQRVADRYEVAVNAATGSDGFDDPLSIVNTDWMEQYASEHVFGPLDIDASQFVMRDVSAYSSYGIEHISAKWHAMYNGVVHLDNYVQLDMDVTAEAGPGISCFRFPGAMKAPRRRPVVRIAEAEAVQTARVTLAAYMKMVGNNVCSLVPVSVDVEKGYVFKNDVYTTPPDAEKAEETYESAYCYAVYLRRACPRMGQGFTSRVNVDCRTGRVVGGQVSVLSRQHDWSW
jgi:hypothetical protein